MDWPRAKTLLLVAFALLNIFLLTQYRQLSASENYKTFHAIVSVNPSAEKNNKLGFDPVTELAEALNEDQAMEQDENEDDDLPAIELPTETPVAQTTVNETELLRKAGIDILPALLPPPADPLQMLRVRLQRPRPGELARSLFGTSDAVNIERFPGGIRYLYGQEELTVFDLGYIRYERKRTGNTNKALELNQSSMRRRVEALDVAQQFLKRLPRLPDDMVLDEINMIDPFTDIVRYVQVFSGLPIFGTVDDRPVGGYLQFTIQSNQVVVFELNRLDVVRAVGTPKELIKPSDALLQLTRQIARPSYGFTVQDMKLGYYAGVYREAENWETVPAWRIRLKDGKSYYVNAYTGLIEKQSTQ